MDKNNDQAFSPFKISILWQSDKDTNRGDRNGTTTNYITFSCIICFMLYHLKLYYTIFTTPGYTALCVLPWQSNNMPCQTKLGQTILGTLYYTTLL